MPNILRVKMRWSGFTGSPGYTVFHFGSEAEGFWIQENAQAAVSKVEAFITGIKGQLPPIVTLVVEPDVEEILEENGQMFTIRTANVAAAQVGTAGGTAGHAASAGAVINWRTGGVRNGRRVRGRTFLVPIAGSAYEQNGSIQPTTLTAISNAANTLRTTTADHTLGVWSRPSAPGLMDGQFHLATGHNVPDMAAVLRSRRD